VFYSLACIVFSNIIDIIIPILGPPAQSCRHGNYI